MHFRKAAKFLDLTNWSVGVSGTVRKFQFAVGVNHQNGSADDVTLRNLLNVREMHSPIDIHLVGFIYSPAYQF
jgi:hypothetical protein